MLQNPTEVKSIQSARQTNGFHTAISFKKTNTCQVLVTKMIIYNYLEKLFKYYLFHTCICEAGFSL